jgi:hypothetical protein
MKRLYRVTGTYWTGGSPSGNNTSLASSSCRSTVLFRGRDTCASVRRDPPQNCVLMDDCGDEFEHSAPHRGGVLQVAVSRVLFVL